MKLFTVGPVEMYEETRRLGSEKIPYFRTDEFSRVMLQVERDFLSLLEAPEGSRLVTLTASGTGAMEAAVINCLSESDKVLVVDGGSFGHRFAEICEIHSVPFDRLELAFGETLTRERLEPYEGAGYTALLVNIDETSTVQLYDHRMLGEFCARNGMLYIVDAISSFLADEFSMEGAGADAVVLSSQKALALPPGLSFVALSPRMIEERVLPAPVKCLYFDFKSALGNGERGQTPFTPAVGTVLQLAQRLRSLAETGVEEEVRLHAERARHFRGLCAENGIETAPYPMSNAATALVFPDGGAREVFLRMKDAKGKMLTPNGGDLSETVLRVGHLGDLSLEDYDELVEDLKEAMDR